MTQDKIRSKLTNVRPKSSISGQMLMCFHLFSKMSEHFSNVIIRKPCYTCTYPSSPAVAAAACCAVAVVCSWFWFCWPWGSWSGCLVGVRGGLDFLFSPLLANPPPSVSTHTCICMYTYSRSQKKKEPYYMYFIAIQ